MATISINFIADSSGDAITFQGSTGVTSINIDNVSLKEVLSPATVSNFPVKEFLYGSTDDNEAIFFRADTQRMQLNPTFETFGTPMSVATRVQRGSLVKCFVALDDEDFYELEGTVTKGVSIVKVHSKNKSNIISPPLTRDIQISWRDSSKQLCRLLQTSIVFIPGTIDENQ